MLSRFFIFVVVFNSRRASTVYIRISILVRRLYVFSFFGVSTVNKSGRWEEDAVGVVAVMARRVSSVYI